MYRRDNPSPEYVEMVRMYSTLHREGAESERRQEEKRSAAQTFSGKMLMEQAPVVADLILRTGSRSLLDYGCGKGEGYEAKDIELAGGEKAASLSEYWKLDNICCYDPGYEPFSQLPTGQFDAVICVDVLEHITEPDLPWVLDELFSYARRFVFANIACYPANKQLPNGQNVHCTVRSPEWWTGLIHAVAMRHTDVSYRFHFETRTGPRRKLGGLYGQRGREHRAIERWAGSEPDR
jgi:hypothetical protein